MLIRLICYRSIAIAVILLVMCMVSPLYSQPQSSQGITPEQLMKLFEVRPLSQQPAWARIEKPPLFTFVWLTDIHLNGSRLDYTRQALKVVTEQFKPDFAVITGDNCAYAPAAPEANTQPLSLRRQLFLKAFLDEHLKLPYAMIPGDNWPYDFDKVFGPSQYSFDVGGLHMMFLSLDQADYRKEGLAVFNEQTWQWIRSDLARNRDRPGIVLLHEPIVPPTFIDAGKLRALLDQYPNVIAAFHGHMHHDMQLLKGVRPSVMAPVLGAGATHGFKMVRVYPHALIMDTYEYDKQTRSFKHASKWQKIDVPKTLRSKLIKPTGELLKTNFDKVPAPPHQDVPELAERSGELGEQILTFLRHDLPMELGRMFFE
jgi:hypothetical protein